MPWIPQYCSCNLCLVSWQGRSSPSTSCDRHESSTCIPRRLKGLWGRRKRSLIFKWLMTISRTPAHLSTHPSWHPPWTCRRHTGFLGNQLTTCWAGEVDDAATSKPVAARAAHLPATLYNRDAAEAPPPRVGWEVLAFLPLLYRMGQKHITAVFILHAFWLRHM